MTISLTKPLRSARKARGDGHLRRAEILQAAETIFVRDGYQGATIRKIAEEVGLSSTALYMHFHDKDEILLEICERGICALLSAACEIAAREADPVIRVRLMLDAFMRFGLENPNTYRLAFCSGRLGLSVMRRQAMIDLARRCFGRFVGAVADIAANGRLRASDVGRAAQTLLAACHGLVTLRINQPATDQVEMEAQMALMLDSLLQGLVVA